MDDVDATLAFNQLSEYLYRYYQKKVIILLDEYDTPMQEAYVDGYWEELAAFTRSLFNATFKTNPYLERAIMTGITRASKESVFSDLNNLEVVTATSEKYETAFGFTQEEVSHALERFGLSDNVEKVRLWYDGFRFGGRRGIYNPWSITKYLDSGKFGSYWANTSSNDLAGELIRQGAPDIKIAVEDLLAGGQILAALDEEVVFGQLEESEEALWSLLLAAGYLKVDEISLSDEEEEAGAIVMEFKVFNQGKEKSLEETVKNALQQIDEKGYDAAKGIPKGKIRHYGFAFEGKKVLIGC